MVVESDTREPSSRLSSPTPIRPQIKNESFLEDINNVLNSGDIPNLYNLDEQDQILNTMRPYIQEHGLQPTKANLMAAYTGRVRSNIHMVLCMRYWQPSRPHRPTGLGGVRLASPEERWPGPCHHAIGARLCVWPPGCHATGLWKGPGSWVPGGVSRCLSASFGLLAL